MQVYYQTGVLEVHQFTTGTKRVAHYDEAHSTIQCDNCELLVRQSEASDRCHVCSAHRQVLNRLALQLNQSQKHRTKPQSHTNIRHLSTPEKDISLQRLHNQARVQQQKNKINKLKKQQRLRSILEEAI